MREISIAEAVNRRIFGAVKAINMASNGTLNEDVIQHITGLC
jgi:hypothetical protein